MSNLKNNIICLLPDKTIEIFAEADDFYKEFDTEIAKCRLDAGNYKVRDRKASLAFSEMLFGDKG